MTTSRQGMVLLCGEEVPYLLVRVRSRRRLSVQVDGQGMLQVRIPWRVTVSQAEQFLGEQAAWIVQQRALAQQKPVLQEGAMLPLLDGAVRLHYGAAQIRPLVQEGEQLWVADRCRERSVLAGLLEQWYRYQALQYLPTRLETWSAKMEISFARLVIRSQKSRWGSCSTRQTISLNWRLMCLPIRVGDYVMVHELCHLRHMNHSPDFWAMVARFVPDYLACRQQLRLFSSPW
ncbi:DUF45 domain-containing protein [uncultured Gammaproteobacteria bacterium]